MSCATKSCTIRAEQVMIWEEFAMTIDGMILAVPILAGATFMVIMLYVSIEDALARRRDDEV